LKIVETRGLAPGSIVKWKSQKGLKWLPLGDQYPVSAFIGSNQMGGESGRKGWQGNRAWEMLTSKPYYDVKKQEFVGLSGPMIETSIATNRAYLEVFKKYKAGDYADIPEGINVDKDIEDLIGDLKKMGFPDNEQKGETAADKEPPYGVDKEAEEEKRQNRSEAMMGNQNAKKDGASDGIKGKERKRINAAFDELFKAVNETGAIRKAIKAENNMRIVFFRKAQKTKEHDDRLEEFKRLILEHLNSEYSEDDEVKKRGCR
jgi:hypothetical protein